MKNLFKVPEEYRITNISIFSTTKADGNRGVFIIPCPTVEDDVHYFQCVVSDGMGWEHVSITLLNKKKEQSNVMPSWEDMCYLKDLFWDETACVVQYHPPHSEYVNNHKFCLHLWRPTEFPLPTPHYSMVGTKS